MALVKCSNCGEQISDKSKNCIHCGSITLNENERNTLEENEKLKNENIKLQNEVKENEKLKNENIKLQNEVKENEKLKNENIKLRNETKKQEFLKEENIKIQEELNALKRDNKKLQKKLDNENKEQVSKTIKQIKKIIINSFNLFRYLIFAFLLIGALASFGKIKLMIIYLLLCLSIAPFTYKFIFKKINLSNKVKVIIQIISPIIILFILVVLGG